MASHVSRTGGNGELSHEKIMRPPSAAVLGDGELLSGTPGREEIRALACALGVSWPAGPLTSGPGRGHRTKRDTGSLAGAGQGCSGEMPSQPSGPRVRGSGKWGDLRDFPHLR